MCAYQIFCLIFDAHPSGTVPFASMRKAAPGQPWANHHPGTRPNGGAVRAREIEQWCGAPLGRVSHIYLLSSLMINNDGCCWKNANAPDDGEREIQSRPTALGLLPITRGEVIPRTVTAGGPKHRSNPEQASTEERNGQEGAI